MVGSFNDQQHSFAYTSFCFLTSRSKGEWEMPVKHFHGSVSLVTWCKYLLYVSIWGHLNAGLNSTYNPAYALFSTPLVCYLVFWKRFNGHIP